MVGAPKHFSRRKPRRCPSCGSTKLAPILWGLPTSDVAQAVDDGKVVLGGCCVSDFDPSWQCTECQAHIYREGLRETR